MIYYKLFNLHTMNKEWEKVKLFHDKFGHPSSDRPAFIPKERAKDRAKWLMEEIAEFLVAPDIYEQADAMIDLIYFALGTLVEMGIKPDELFDIIPVSYTHLTLPTTSRV